MKRIVVCCDGTWQNGMKETRTNYTNVLRLARAIMQEDNRIANCHGISQVVYYQPGIGTDQSLYSRYVEGSTGSSLGDKVEEAYAFIAHNYHPGDEIFLFGFSRGAYTARMVAQFIGEIGMLDRTDMDSFGEIFINYQTYGRTEDQAQKKILKQALAPWQDPESNGKKRIGHGKFSVKFLGVWDTVGSVGLPGGFLKENNIFGFNDSLLGDHIERACQALAIDEMRRDFICNKLNQTPAGKAKDQYVKQVWFSGAHSDIGGSYNHHDLSDLALIWMANELDKYLSLDFVYLRKHIEPVALWGKQEPHDSSKGIFVVTRKTQRPLPTKANDDVTHEFIHESVLQQTDCPSAIQSLVQKHPGIVCPLGDVEKEFKKDWPYDKNSLRVQQYVRDLKEAADGWLN